MLNFIDLFAGVGGFHAAFKDLVHCVFASEINPCAQKTYQLNFPKTPLFGDITDLSVQAQIPPHFDILCAGFPCQAFSIAGYQRGFEDTRGTLFTEGTPLTSFAKLWEMRYNL
ncbi:DNA (cytosine-5-)-methyltransferase [Helicobacter bizzozeronii]|uniref:DNA (cytosine-5-)-methyltransferase n=1 Tax=Helicobacter bizzozeronii TaxID=56877 RepID=UPI000CF0F8A0|nr:DNA (cytosine-5-)-methyltransferase [Helicobacter bizzozeronii]